MTKVPDDDLLKRVMRSLAFHVVETELTLQFVNGDASEIRDEIQRAKGLIEEAGFDFDDLYPLEDRPTATVSKP